MSLKCFLLVVLLAIGYVSVSSGKRTVVCYLSSWANYRHGDGKYVVENIDPFECTHAVYAYAKIENNKIIASDSYLDLEENNGLAGYKRFNDLRLKNPSLKTLIAIGGWNGGSEMYSQMVSSESDRTIFVQSVLDFLDKYGFRGLSIDWHYPATRGGKPQDKPNLVLLLKELREAFGPKNYTLTAAVDKRKSINDFAYDIPGLSRYLDLIIIMAYDFHGHWDAVTGFNAPLYANESASENEKQLTVDWAVRYWIDGGAKAEKIVMGIAFFGRTFKLKDPSNHGVGAKKEGTPAVGIYTGVTELLGFHEICLHLTRNGWTEKWDDVAKAPYAYKGDQWVGYDNERSIEAKVEYIKAKELAGAMIWTLDTDDFRGACYGQPNYLQDIVTRNLWSKRDNWQCVFESNNI